MAPRPIDVEIRANGVDGVRRQLRLVNEAAEELGEEGGQASRHVAGALLEIAHSGDVGVRSLKELTVVAAEFATGFGAAGPILGAVGLLGAAFYETFERAKKEIEETRKKFEEELANMVNAGDYATLTKKLEDLYKGTPAKGFKDGLELLDQQEREILGRLQNTAGITHAAIQHELDEFRKNTHIEDIRKQFEDVRAAILDIGNTPLKIQGLAAVGITGQSDRAIADAMKRQFEGAAYLAAHDLANNTVFAQQVGAAWKAMWERVAIDSQTAKETQEIVKKMIQDTIEGATKDATQGANVAGSASTTIAAMRRAVPLFSPKFWQDMTSFIKQDVDRAITDLATWINQRFAETIGAALHDGITTAFEKGANIGNVFAAVLGSILSSLGAALEEIGTSMLAAFTLLKGLKEALAALAPEIGIPLAIATIALGAALQGAGARATANSPVGGGYGGPGYSASTVSSSVAASTQGPVTVYLPKSGYVLDPNNKDSVDGFLDFLQQLQSTRQVNLVVQ